MAVTRNKCGQYFKKIGRLENTFFGDPTSTLIDSCAMFTYIGDICKEMLYIDWINIGVCLSGIHSIDESEYPKVVTPIRWDFCFSLTFYEVWIICMDLWSNIVINLRINAFIGA